MADTVRSAGVVTGKQAADWVAEQRRRAHDDRLFVAVPMFVAAASRPF
ncbi:hypothetical protein ACWDV4_03925 [Micromonospora sp. NPDC003197]